MTDEKKLDRLKTEIVRLQTVAESVFSTAPVRRPVGVNTSTAPVLTEAEYLLHNQLINLSDHAIGVCKSAWLVLGEPKEWIGVEDFWLKLEDDADKKASGAKP